MDKINLAGEWKLRCEFLDVTADRFHEVLQKDFGDFKLDKGGKEHYMPSKTGFWTVAAPCDVITPLCENGILNEPLLKTNTDDCMWIGNYSWWFMRAFDVSAATLAHEEVRLFIETLDYNAHIMLNGRILANHKNTFRAFQQDVKRFLKEGTNQIIIRLTTGYEEHYPNDSLTYYCNSQFAQRVYLRKPQFTHGWDWCKPVPTCGMGGKMYIEGCSGANIRSFRCDTLSIDHGATLDFSFEIENLSLCTADDAVLTATLQYNGETVYRLEMDLYLAGGINYVTQQAVLENPHLWYPNGYGDQPLYTVNAAVTCRGITRHMDEKKIGIRTLRCCMDKLSDNSRRFDFMVNGIKVFCKGGNWVPADSVYLRVTPDKYRALVDEAAACNFTMLRIWGGGLYEPDCFYDRCSEKGILVMQDFMYACAFYPDNLDWFVNEATLEAVYQVKRLAHQACLAAWTGNNEIHESYTDWFTGHVAPEAYYGTKLFNYIFPETVKHYSPLTHYMPSSPFYGNKANDMLAGDCHMWNWTNKPHDTAFAFTYELEAFDRMAAKVRFSSEYGFYGPLRKSSIERFHDGEEIDMQSKVWTHHGEHAGKRQHILKSLDRHMADPSTLDVDSYLLAAGILQGCLYDELTTSLRLRDHCSGQLIWMYNDCWPETGWTIIDYYLQRKISYYFLKRSFETQKLITRIIDKDLWMTAINEQPFTLDLVVEHGWMDFYGNKKNVVTEKVSIPPHSKYNFPSSIAELDTENGFYYMLPHHANIKPAISRRAYFRDVPFPKAAVTVKSTRPVDGHRHITLCADAFVPVVQIITKDDRIKMSDNFFPLLPGQEAEVVLYGCDEDPVVATPVHNGMIQRLHK